MNRFQNAVLLCLVITFLVTGCSMGPSYSTDASAALDAAGDNRAELEAVIEHYRLDDDTLKLAAAFHLIGNMPGHCYVTYVFKDSADSVVDLNATEFIDFDALLSSVDSIERVRGELDYARDERFDDVETITADFLIEHIDYAFRAWREKPWARQLSFDEFCAYVLPYRGSNEPLESWRRPLWERYESIDSLITDPVEAATLINNELRDWFRFDERYYFHPTDQGLSEMMDSKMGRCEDMTNLSIFAMRANGLAVTSDYTPAWADHGNNHAWNAILTSGGEVVPFMGGEANPGDYGLYYRAAKVYRKTFAQQKQNLIFQERRQEKVPGWLAGKSYVDVTADYYDVHDVAVHFEQPIPDSIDIAYLCVFNSGHWRAIHWGRIDGDSAVFSDMVGDIVYIPALYVNEELEPVGTPFILDSDGQIHSLVPSGTEFMTAGITSTTKRTQDASTEGVAKTWLEAGKSYEMFYWDGEWQSLGMKKAGKKPLAFDDVPADALYWLVAEGSNEDAERIFTLKDGLQIWW